MPLQFISRFWCLFLQIKPIPNDESGFMAVIVKWNGGAAVGEKESKSKN